MIKVNELRIGNLVRYKDRRDFVAEVTCITKLGGVELLRYFTNEDIDTQLESIEYLTPIEPTEYILLQLGFEKSITYLTNNLPVDNYQIGRFQVTYYKGDFKLKNSSVVFKSIHQLQNVYFAFMGAELTIEPKHRF